MRESLPMNASDGRSITELWPRLVADYWNNGDNLSTQSTLVTILKGNIVYMDDNDLAALHDVETDFRAKCRAAMEQGPDARRLEEPLPDAEPHRAPEPVTRTAA